MRRNIKNFFAAERGQVSIEFVLLTGGVVAAAVIFWSLGGSIRALGTTTSNWVAQERTITINRITR
ncbi:MAG TPA: class III signal peptide-containing protein [Euryarchaeota archaeon]|nr:class III signal peptide [archaeon BMS3Bbin16]HDH28317.1 class III signal peptide-containing protein [Euryarchaeota archaeon]